GRRADRQGVRLRCDRQPLEGHVVTGRAVPEPHVRLRRDRGDLVSFFRSRWLEVPDGVRDAASPGLPAGFRAAGLAAGIKPSGATDVGLLVSDAPETTSAARFTRSGVLAAPVLVTQERSEIRALRALVVNAGNANAATGTQGIEVALRMQAAAAAAAGVEQDRVAVASTGVIGAPLDGEAVAAGRAAPRPPPRRGGGAHLPGPGPDTPPPPEPGGAGGRASGRRR